ncbi:hypothetical protein SGFS_080390 [Streptomyces graminofaciens]|uniref:Uncharacterized protein n=1 Tax=Streptomyces graminofaciens TaxID=68212 RepID=A0ABN5VTU6_9ACTN|nr:hypothetical protein SGFS_080390 [Streptomyces graminofaciens]
MTAMVTKLSRADLEASLGPDLGGRTLPPGGGISGTAGAGGDHGAGDDHGAAGLPVRLPYNKRALEWLVRLADRAPERGAGHCASDHDGPAPTDAPRPPDLPRAPDLTPWVKFAPCAI